MLLQYLAPATGDWPAPRTEMKRLVVAGGYPDCTIE